MGAPHTPSKIAEILRYLLEDSLLERVLCAHFVPNGLMFNHRELVKRCVLDYLLVSQDLKCVNMDEDVASEGLSGEQALPAGFGLAT